MQLHELVDREDPRCLYCNCPCDLRQIGDMMLAPVGHPLFRLRFEVQILKCQSCREIFEIHWTEDNENVVKFTGFVFSCKSIVVQSIYASGFGIGNKELLQPEQYEPQFAKSYIPEFVVNFSDKKKLHKKLKTYLVFS